MDARWWASKVVVDARDAGQDAPKRKRKELNLALKHGAVLKRLGSTPAVTSTSAFIPRTSSITIVVPTTL